MTVEGLKEVGLAEMSDEQIHNFLTHEGFGVLALPTEEGPPYVIPMAFGYDGESRLFFSYFIGEESRKYDLSKRTETARFLVYSADSPFFWESVILTGTLVEVPGDEWDEYQAALENSWHLDLFEKADRPGQVRLYEFTITDRSGLKYSGLPPGLQEPGQDDAQ